MEKRADSVPGPGREVRADSPVWPRKRLTWRMCFFLPLRMPHAYKTYICHDARWEQLERISSLVSVDPVQIQDVDLRSTCLLHFKERRTGQSHGKIFRSSGSESRAQRGS